MRSPATGAVVVFWQRSGQLAQLATAKESEYWRRERVSCEVQPPLRKMLNRRLTHDREAHRWRRNRVPKLLIVRKQAGCSGPNLQHPDGARRSTVDPLTNFRFSEFADLRSIIKSKVVPRPPYPPRPRIPQAS